MYTIAQIEDAIIERLKTQLTYLKTCAPLADYLVDEIEDITIRFPAAYVVYSEGSFDHAMSGVQDRPMIFAVIVMAKNLRGDIAARHGQGAEKGAYEMLEDVRETLTGQKCGLDIDELLPLDEGPTEGTEAVAQYGIRFGTRCRFTL